MVGKEGNLGHFRHVPRSFGENSWSQYCSSLSSLQSECSENTRFALQFIHFCSFAAAFLTITVLKQMKRGEITEFKIKTGDSKG